MHFMTRLSDIYGMGTKGFSPEFIEMIMAYGWPGNVRELAHAMENILTTSSEDPILFPKHLPTHIRVAVTRASVDKGPKTNTDPESRDDQETSLVRFSDFRSTAIHEAEKSYLTNLVSLTSGNIQEACKRSGLSRARLYALLKKHRIQKKR